MHLGSSSSSTASRPLFSYSRTICILFAFLATGLLFYTLTYSAIPSLALRLPAPYNNTLGFERIYMIVLPHRTDQIDAITLLSSASSLDFTLVDGVLPANINPNYLPAGNYRPDNTFSHGGQLGCWRSHMDVMREIVASNVQSALVLEADVDWDVRIKAQLAAVSAHLPNTTATAPYGLDWDVMWLGHCAHRGNERDGGKHLGEAYAMYKDSTVEKVPGFAKEFLELYGVREQGRRLLAASYASKWKDPTCTAAYAITRNGAKKLLYELSYNRLEAAVDSEMARLTREGKLPGIVVTPPLMGQYRTGSRRDSEIDGGNEAEFQGMGEGIPPDCVGRSARKILGGTIYGAEV